MYIVVNEDDVWYVKNTETEEKQAMESQKAAEGKANLLNNMLNNYRQKEREAEDRKRHNKNLTKGLKKW